MTTLLHLGIHQQDKTKLDMFILLYERTKIYSSIVRSHAASLKSKMKQTLGDNVLCHGGTRTLATLAKIRLEIIIALLKLS